jgi:hypothetical protein
MRFIASVLVSLVGFCVGFGLAWMLRESGLDIGRTAIVGEGYVVSSGYRLFSVVCGLTCGIVWGATTYLNYPYEGWIKRALLSALKAAATAVFIFCIVYVATQLFLSAAVPSAKVSVVATGYMFAKWAIILSCILGAGFSVSCGYIVWRRGIRPTLSSEEIQTKGVFNTVLAAPFAPYAKDAVLTENSIDTGQTAYTLIGQFEKEVVNQDIDGLQARSVLYADGLQVVPLRPDRELGAFPVGGEGIRSHAFRIRRGFDEFWFVLHVKFSRGSLSWQLDAKTRTRNTLGPVMLIASIVFVFVAWFFHSQILSGVLIALAVIGWMINLGVWESLFSKERGETRRKERLEEYTPAFSRAAFQALKASLKLPGLTNSAPQPGVERSSQPEPRPTVAPTVSSVSPARRRRD